MNPRSDFNSAASGLAYGSPAGMPSSTVPERDCIIIADDELSSLRRFKDDVKEVASGYECGMGLNKFNDIKEGDILESYIIEEYRD